MSEKYEYWRYAYFHKHTNEFTLNKLATGGKLTESEVTQIIQDRITEYGE